MQSLHIEGGVAPGNLALLIRLEHFLRRLFQRLFRRLELPLLRRLDLLLVGEQLFHDFIAEILNLVLHEEVPEGLPAQLLGQFQEGLRILNVLEHHRLARLSGNIMAQEGLQRSGLDQSGIEVGFRLSPLLHDHLHQDHLGQGGPGVLGVCASQGRVGGCQTHHACDWADRIPMHFSHIEGGVAPGDRVIIIGNQFLKILRLVLVGGVQVQLMLRDIFFQIFFGLL